MEKNISIIIPCRNEERFIGQCLDSIISQDFPKENLEVLVVNGVSEDKTGEIVKEYSLKYPFIRLLENQQKFTPFGLNIGIKNSQGEIVIRMDAHAGYGKDYISKCVKYLKGSGADNVGGVIRTLPAKDTIVAKSIAYVLSTPLGAVSSFRLGSKKAIEVDTVFGGCYKREIFDRVGLFNEKMLRSQDIEFNKRLKKSGGKIILAPDIVAIYYPQTTLSGFLKHNFSDGVWVTYPLKFGVRYFSLRHLIPMFLTGSLMASLILGLFYFPARMFFVLIFGAYLFSILSISLGVSLRKGFRYFFILPLVIFSRHFGYGLGSIWGLIRLIT